MDIGEILAYSGGGVAAIMTLLQISKININPWSAVMKVVRKILFTDINNRLDDIQKQLNSLESDNKRQDSEHAEDKAIESRGQIIQFADEIRRGVRHSEENFNRIFDHIKSYRNYCDEHPKFKNDKAVTSINIIEDVYHKCMVENDFL